MLCFSLHQCRWYQSFLCIGHGLYALSLSPSLSVYIHLYDHFTSSVMMSIGRIALLLTLMLYCIPMENGQRWHINNKNNNKKMHQKKRRTKTMLSGSYRVFTAHCALMRLIKCNEKTTVLNRME